MEIGGLLNDEGAVFHTFPPKITMVLIKRRGGFVRGNKVVSHLLILEEDDDDCRRRNYYIMFGFRRTDQVGRIATWLPSSLPLS
jgi:hypothetical protein